MQESSTEPTVSRFRRLLGQLWFQVLLGVVLGIIVGIFLPGIGAHLSPLGDWFIAIIKAIVVPVVFCVVTLGIASMDSLRKAGSIGLKALGYFIVLSFISMIIGLLAANIFKPGAGMHIDVSQLDSSAVPKEADAPVDGVGFITHMIPTNVLGAIGGHEILAALVASVVIGCALNVSGAAGQKLTDLVSALSTVVFRIVDWVMRLAPIAAFGALAATVSSFGVDSLAQLGYLILVFYIACVVFIVVVLGTIAWATKINIFTLMRYLRAELLIALATCSSEATLPGVIDKLKKMGVGKSTVGIVIPSGFSFNLDGSAVYLTMAALFLCQAVGIDLSWQQQLIMVGVMMLTSKGTAGIAGGAFIVLASTITALGNVPLAALGLIVGIDRILNEGRVFINVLGNSLAAIVIGKWEKDFDAELAKKTLSEAYRDTAYRDGDRHPDPQPLHT